LNISLNHFAQFNWGLVLVIEMPYYRARADGTPTFLTQTNQHLEINIQLDQMGQNFGDWLGMGPGFICHLDRTDYD
jgi:hypothetical protein